MVKEKRRSDRILLTIPLSVEGADAKGQPFQAKAQTLVLNRHGGRIRASHRLEAEQVVRIVNVLSRRSADFRVVGPVSPFSEQGGEFGVECVHPGEDIWGIQFPPLGDGEAEKSNALLECRSCHQVKLVPVSLVEVEVLETSGILNRYCETCGASSQWSHTRKPVSMPEPPGETGEKPEKAPSPSTQGRERRRYRRVSLQLPVRICKYDGGVEITRSENISKGGFCFVSEKAYKPGEGIMVICPYNSTGENIEVRARVVSSSEMEGSPRKIYGVQFLDTER